VVDHYSLRYARITGFKVVMEWCVYFWAISMAGTIRITLVHTTLAPLLAEDLYRYRIVVAIRGILR